MFALTFV